MDSKELYGRFVLQAEEARTSAGSFFRAVQLGGSGYEKHVQLFRSEPLAPDALRSTADGLKLGLLVQHPQVSRGFESGQLDKAAFAAYEMLEGRSVGALMHRSQSEGHPFAADHALLIASKVAAALEAAQARKQIHGFLVPEFVQVSHDGEVVVRGFGLPPRVLRASNCVGVRESAILAPEVDTNLPLDIRADVFSLGAQLFEMLTGTALTRNQPTLTSVQAARSFVPGTDGNPLPKALTSLLAQALAEDPAARFKDATAFRKSVDTLLFSGDYSPTTFNLAFFMHTLFRDEGDEDAACLKAERSADYQPYLVARPGGAGGASASRPASVALAAPALSQPLPASIPATRPEAAKPEAPKGDSGRPARPPVTSVPDQSADHIFPTGMVEKKAFPAGPVALGTVVVLAIAAYFLRGTLPEEPKPPARNPAVAAALERVRELESRLTALEAEKVAAEQKAAEDAKKVVEAQAKARGRAVDPEELQRAQDDARRKAQIEQEARLFTERLKIEEERKRAQDTQAAEAAKSVESTTSTTPAPAAETSTPLTAPVTPPPATPLAAPPAPVVVAPAAASVATGPSLLELGSPGVVPPELISQPKIAYPPIARAQRLTGSVVLSALVDEQGRVSEVRIIRGATTSNSGFDKAALDSVKGRMYKPATLNGKPGRVWVTIEIDFRL